MKIAAFETLDQLADVVGTEVAVGAWLTLDQPCIDGFAAVTGDHQWIHVDPERARAESPFGSTIAHGFLVISSAAASMLDVVKVQGAAMATIYGLDRVRFVAPAPAGIRVRARITLERWTPRPEGGQADWAVSVEGDGMEKPVAVFELIVRYTTATLAAE
ncbi:MAG: MaoC family dehydratase [Azoarcus sp.]|nr:MaoC family dehydratase [Azoarcus sp.]